MTRPALDAPSASSPRNRHRYCTPSHSTRQRAAMLCSCMVVPGMRSCERNASKSARSMALASSGAATIADHLGHLRAPKRRTSAASASERCQADSAGSVSSQARHSKSSRRARLSARSLVGSRKQRSRGTRPLLARNAENPSHNHSMSSRLSVLLATRCARIN